MAFHNASLSVEDRKAVEKGYLEGHISIICCTSTLAVGINLPCYLVVLKGTQGYGDAGLQEYSSLEIMQMLGRAGRPQLESEACALILCFKEQAKKYEKMVAGEEVLESSLHRNLVEHLNAEIGLGTITSLESAKSWLRSTFLHVRLQQNARYYDAESDNRFTNPEDVLSAWCERDLALLEESDLVRDNGTLRCSEYGEAMAKYCVKLQTMQAFMALRAKAKISEVLDALCQAHEFRQYRWKAGEKTMFKEINSANEMRYPVKGTIDNLQQKVSIIIQARLGGVPLGKDAKSKVSGNQLRQLQIDTSGVLGHAKRLIRCMVDILVHRGDSIATKNTLELARCLAAGAWDDTVLQFKQIPGLGDVAVRKLAAANIKNIDALFNTEPRRVEVILSKHPPYGQELLKKLADFPMLHVSAQAIDKKHKDRKGVEVKLKCQAGFLNGTHPKIFNKRSFQVLFLCETSYGELVHFQRFWPNRLKDPADILLTAMVVQAGATIRCHVMCDDVAGTHKVAEVNFDCPASWFPPKQIEYAAGFERPTLPSKISGRGEDFDTDGVNDLDLLEAADHAEDGDEIIDIDDIESGLMGGAHISNSRKRSTSTNAEQDIQWREPKQLPNGNWTCQHDCAERGKQCKHPCCLNGVKGKKPKPPSAKRQKKAPDSATSVANTKPKKQQESKQEQSQNEGPLDKMLTKSRTTLNETTKHETQKRHSSSSTSISSAEFQVKGSEAVPESVKTKPITFDLSGLTSDSFDFEHCDWETIDNIAAQFDEPTTAFDDAVNANVDSSFFSEADLHDTTGKTEAPLPETKAEITALESDQRMFMSSNSSPKKTDDKPWIADNPDDDFAFDEVGSEAMMDTLQDTYSPESAQSPASLGRNSASSATTLSNTNVDVSRIEQTPAETGAERERRLYLEDQKRRWAEIPCNHIVNYENLGAFVQIVSDTEDEG